MNENETLPDSVVNKLADMWQKVQEEQKKER